MDLQAMSPSPACQRCCLVPGLSESHQLGFSKRRDKMISDDGSGTKIRVRYWITSVKQPRDFSQGRRSRSEEHTSELQSLMRISYAVFCLKKKKKNTIIASQKH